MDVFWSLFEIPLAVLFIYIIGPICVAAAKKLDAIS